MTRRDLARSIERALARMDLSARTRAALSRTPRPRAPVRVVAVGKAAPAMAEGALAAWGEAIERAVVVVPDGTPASLPAEVEVLRAGHPLPDARSVRAAERVLDFVRSAEPRLILVLVSGGASALLAAPIAGLSLAEKRRATRAMLRARATIQEINVVRKHLSRIKGGGLLRAARPNAVVTLVASDVVGGRASDVGSGPSVPETSTVRDARALLARYAPGASSLPLARSPRVAGGRCRIIASPEELARVVAEELRRSSVRARVLPPSQADAYDLAREYASLAARLGPREAVVRAAEPSLAIPVGAKRGGRSSHLAALVALALPPSAVFAAVATDGVDGTSGAGGAIVDGRLVRRVGREAIERALARFDTGALHLAAGTALCGGPRGHNLADLHVLVTTRASRPRA